MDSPDHYLYHASLRSLLFVVNVQWSDVNNCPWFDAADKKFLLSDVMKEEKDRLENLVNVNLAAHSPGSKLIGEDIDQSEIEQNSQTVESIKADLRHFIAIMQKRIDKVKEEKFISIVLNNVIFFFLLVIVLVFCSVNWQLIEWLVVVMQIIALKIINNIFIHFKIT